MAEHPPSRTGSRRTVLRMVAAAFAPAALAPAGAVAAAATSRETDLREFDRLVLQVPADVSIRIGSRNHVRIEAEQQVIDRIAVRSEGSTLKVTASDSFQTREPITIVIECTRLTALEAHASVEVRLSGLKAKAFELTAGDSAAVSLEGLNLESLQADIEGSATVNASGRVHAQSASVAGAATYDARKLQSATARIEASGSSEVAVDTRQSLEVNVSDSATVRYAGKPRLKPSVTGAGTLEPI